MSIDVLAYIIRCFNGTERLADKLIKRSLHKSFLNSLCAVLRDYVDVIVGQCYLLYQLDDDVPIYAKRFLIAIAFDRSDVLKTVAHCVNGIVDNGDSWIMMQDALKIRSTDARPTTW